ncbi:hypothetical protein MBLNU230_g8110t1 [Neophaeotheca triangularis]
MGLFSVISRIRHGFRDARDKLLPGGEAVASIAAMDMLCHNWHLGFTSFGGPTVHFQIFRRLFVEKYAWLDEQSYQEMFALCQALCGPGSTKMLYAVNALHYGFWTGVGAFLVWSLPMAVAAFGLGLGVASIGDELPGPVYALLSGLNSATVGIVALAAVQLSNKAITDTLTRCLVFFGAAAGILYNALWYFPVLLVAGGIVTVVWDLKLLHRLYRSMVKTQPSNERRDDNEIELARSSSPSTPEANAAGLHARHGAKEHTTNEQRPTEPELPDNATPAPQSLTSWKVGTAVLASFATVFIITMVLRGTQNGLSRAFDVFANLFLAGTIIFGGGPVVIPLLREYIVAEGWVSPRDFLLGLAITQAFPGPNFNFAVYLGSLAMAGSSYPSVVGAVLAYVAIFAPGLWLHTGFMGIWSTVRRIQAVKAGLRGVHATAVGLVFGAVYRLFEIGYLDADVQAGGSLSRDPWWVVVVATSFVGGKHFGLSPPLAIVLGAVAGLVWYGVVTS